jgi:tripartite-type tricarboxylate transporter receptor subunit TctC
MSTTGNGQESLKVILPFSPGGAPDVAIRLLQTPLSKQLNRPVHVDYKVGAGGEIGHRSLSQSGSETMVLGMSTVSVVANTVLKNPPPYNLDNLIPVAYIQVPFVLLVSQKSNIKNLKDLRNHQGNLTYGTFGHGSATHIITEQLAKNVNKSWTHVPYKGAPSIIQALLAGDIDMAFVFYPQALPVMSDNKLIPLTIDLPQRHPDWPHIPTFSEFNLKQVSNISYVILLSNSVTDTKEIVRVQTAIKEILKDKYLLEKFNNSGFVVDFNQLILPRDFLTKEKTRISRLVLDLNIEN